MAERRYTDLDDLMYAMEPRFNRRAAYTTVRNMAALYDAFVAALITDTRHRTAARTPDDLVNIPAWVVVGLNRELSIHLPEQDAHRRGDLDPLVASCKRTFPRATHGRTGRLAHWLRRYGADHVHYQRFADVWFWHLRDPGWYYPGQKGTFGWNLLRKGTSRVGHDDDRDVFEHVAAQCEHGPPLYRGAPKTIAKSFDLVTRAIDDGEIGRFYPSKFVRIPGALRSADEDRCF